MLSVDSTASPAVLAVVFGLILAALVLNAILKDRREYRRFSALTSSHARRRTLRKWLLQSFALFGSLATVSLVLAWQFIPAVLAALDDIDWVADARAGYRASDLAPSIVAVVLVAIVAVMIIGIVAARRATEIPSIGDVQALLPRNRSELKYGALLSINAGVVEELLFRLAMPAVVFGFTRSIVIAVVVSVIVFGALHAYQGIGGVIGATVIGAVLMAVYLTSENILVAIAVHALFDLRSLVLIPLVVTRAHRIAAAD